MVGDVNMAIIEIENCLSDEHRNGTIDFINRIRIYHSRKMIRETKEEIEELNKRIAELDKKKAEYLKAKTRK